MFIRARMMATMFKVTMFRKISSLFLMLVSTPIILVS